MGVLLILIGIVVIISIITVINEFAYRKRYGGHFKISTSAAYSSIWALVIAGGYGVVVAISLSVSYGTYMNTRAYYDNLIAQYKGAIVLYEDKAVALDMEKAASHALTDMKYQGYQKQMGDFILDLRRSITRYNSTVIKKRLMKKNFFYGWYVVAPDPDMQLINIVDKSQ